MSRQISFLIMALAFAATHAPAMAQQTPLESSLWNSLLAVPAHGQRNQGETKFQFSERINKARENTLRGIISGSGGIQGVLAQELTAGNITLNEHRVLRDGQFDSTDPNDNLAVRNLVLKLGSGLKPTIVVGAHLDKVPEAGTGVIDDWSGAVLIIHACKMLSEHSKTHNLNHNFVFVCFAYEESGLWGSTTFVNDLKVGESVEVLGIGGLHNVKAMVNIECLGVSGLYGWKEGSTEELTNAAEAVDSDAGVDFENRSIPLPVGADSVPFFFEGVPAITIDSLRAPPDPNHDFGKIHTQADTLSNISKERYLSTLGFVTRYLLHLDQQMTTDTYVATYRANRRARPSPASNPLVRSQPYGHGMHSTVIDSSSFAAKATANGSFDPPLHPGVRIADGVVALHDSAGWVIVALRDGKMRTTRLDQIRDSQEGTPIMPRP